MYVLYMFPVIQGDFLLVTFFIRELFTLIREMFLHNVVEPYECERVYMQCIYSGCTVHIHERYTNTVKD
jgi:hypothetical protein